jgi:hypothetical protein
MAILEMWKYIVCSNVPTNISFIVLRSNLGVRDSLDSDPEVPGSLSPGRLGRRRLLHSRTIPSCHHCPLAVHEGQGTLPLPTEGLQARPTRDGVWQQDSGPMRTDPVSPQLDLQTSHLELAARYRWWVAEMEVRAAGRLRLDDCTVRLTAACGRQGGCGMEPQDSGLEVAFNTCY